jgi:heme-degrading monooxygenase HmoA
MVPPRAEEPAISATLINVFQVPAGREDAFLSLWEATDELLRRNAGYSSTRLRRAITPDARFQFIAELDSVEQWRGVITSPEFGAIAARMAEFQPSPGLYTVAREHRAEHEPGSGGAR